MDSITSDNWPDPLSDYEPVELIATGRMSTVVRATDASTGRQVALKILHDHFAHDEAVRQRLRREFAAVRRLDHPAVVRADDLLEDDDTLALVMEYVDGESVRQRVERQGPLDWQQARPVLDDVLAAVAQAHRRGILHRDLNAEHILINNEGRGRIVGFGLARVDELVALTMHTQVLGSLEAMAPERVLGMDYDGRADLFSVGAVAHEMLLGHPPGDGTMRTAFQQAHSDATSLLSERSDDLPQTARHLLERALATDAGARFATAAQMRRALDGDYDEQLWNRWASRDTRSCPNCDTAVIEGTHTCIDCGHQFRRLVRNPGAGTKVVRIISPREAFDPDVWFERNDEPEYLPDDTLNELMELLDTYEDTKRVADFGPPYRWPPYILFGGLDDEDAHRVSKRLEQREIPHRVETEAPSRFARFRRSITSKFQFDKSTRNLALGGAAVVVLTSLALVVDIIADARSPDTPFDIGALFGIMVYLGLYFALMALVIGANLIAQMNRKSMATTALAIFLLINLWVFGTLGFGLSTTVIAACTGAFLFGLLGTRFGTLAVKSRISDDDRPAIAGLPIMIPIYRLEAVDLPDDTVELPSRTARVLNNCQSDAIRRELYELLVLAISVARRGGVTDTDAFEQLIDDVLDAGQRLDELHADLQSESTAELYNHLEQIDASIEKADSQRRDELQKQRRRVLDAIEDHDRAVHRITHHRTTLQLARGAMLDMLSDAAHPQVVLDFGDETDEAMVQLTTSLQAVAELDELVTVEEPS